MSTVLRRLAGEEMSLDEEVQGCFGVVPQRIDEAEFESGLRETFRWAVSEPVTPSAISARGARQ